MARVAHVLITVDLDTGVVDTDESTLMAHFDSSVFDEEFGMWMHDSEAVDLETEAQLPDFVDTVVAVANVLAKKLLKTLGEN